MIKPGDTITFKRGGVERTEIVKSIGYQTAQPAVYPTVPLWQRIVRALTPARWRKPIKPLHEAIPAQVLLAFEGPAPDAIERHHRMLTDALRFLDGLTR